MPEFPLIQRLLAEGLLVESLGWALLHFLWQGALIAGAYALLRLGLDRAPARLRLWLGYLALLAMAVAPAWTVLRHLLQALPAGATAAAGATSTAVAAAQAAAADPALTPALVESALPWLVAAWLVGVLALSLRGFRQWRALRRLCLVSLPAEPHWQQRLDQLCLRMGVTQAVQLRECALVAAPMLVGWLKPVVLLPVALVTRLPAAQVELLLAHELAHVRRLDYLANLLQMALETVLFYHPAVHWISRCVREDREQCCDDLVTASGADRLDYARALLSLAEQHAGVAPAMAMAASGGVLLERIERIVQEPRSVSPAAATTPLLLLAGAVLLAAVGARALAPGDRLDAAPALLPTLGLGSAELALPAWHLAIADLRHGPAPRLAPARLATPVQGAAAEPEAASAIPQAALPAAAGRVEPRPEASLPVPRLASVALPEPAAAAPGEPPAGDLAPAEAGPVALAMHQPVYPRKARLAGIEGWVRLSYLVDPAGRPYEIRVEDTYPNRVFAAAARDALSRWQFAAMPASGTRFQQTFDFVLEGRAGEAAVHCDVATGSHICRRRN